VLLQSGRHATLWSLGLSIGLALLSLPVAEAGLSVSPVRVVLQGKPKQKQRGAFVLENLGAAPIKVFVEPEDWAQGLSGDRGPVDWLKVRPESLTLRPGKRAKVKYTVRVPKGAVGELRSQIFFVTEQGGEGESALMRSRLGTIIYVAVEGTARLEGSINRVQVLYAPGTPGVDRPDRMDVILSIHNQGNTHMIPEGEVVVHDEHGQAVATLRLVKGWGLLPSQEDNYHAIGNGVHLREGRYSLDVRIRAGEDLGQLILMTKTLEMEVDAKGNARLIEPPPAPPPAP
jgi:hypothetical protein